MDSNLKREIIIENYQNPMHREKKEEKGFIEAHTISDSCIDNITLFVEFDGDIIKDIYFEGEACAITTSATSIMIKKIIGKKISDVEELMHNYYNMIDEKEYNYDLLGELNVYDEIYKQPNRKKCAIFPFETLKKAIEKYRQSVK